MHDEESDRFHPQFPRTTRSLEALKAVVAAQAIRDAALVAFVEADRKLHDAQQEMKTARLMGKVFK